MGNRQKLRLPALLTILAVGAAVWVYRKPASHSVMLTWQAPRPTPGVTIVGYNVYRRSKESSSYVKIADRVPGAPYEDLLVSTGREYSYVVTTVDRLGRESRFSKEATARVP